MLSRKEIRQRLQAPVQVGIVVVADRAFDGLAELLTGIEFHGEHTVELPVHAEGPHHMMRRAHQVVAAQPMHRVELPIGRPRRAVSVPAEPGPVKLANYPRVAVLLLVGIHLIAAPQPKGAKRRYLLVHAQLIAKDPAQKSVHGVVGGYVTDVFAKNDASRPPRRSGPAVRLTDIQRSNNKLRGLNVHFDRWMPPPQSRTTPDCDPGYPVVVVGGFPPARRCRGSAATTLLEWFR